MDSKLYLFHYYIYYFLSILVLGVSCQFSCYVILYFSCHGNFLVVRLEGGKDGREWRVGENLPSITIRVNLDKVVILDFVVCKLNLLLFSNLVKWKKCWAFIANLPFVSYVEVRFIWSVGCAWSVCV